VKGPVISIAGSPPIHLLTFTLHSKPSHLDEALQLLNYTMAAQTNVVILGASFTGTGVAHSVLKNVPNAKVTLINPSDLFYFALAAPRVLAKPAEVPLDKVLISIPNAFKQYPEAKFQFVRGSVTSVDVAAKTVSLQDQTTIKYDYLVIATGATTPSTISEQITPFKPTPGGDLKQSIQDAQQRISNATSIIIGGAGPIGVETAGEISQAYKAKSVTLISSHDQLLPGLKPSVAAAAASNLKRHGVEIILSAKITDSQLQADGKWKVMLSNGKTLDTDLYISAMGSIPNTSFLDPVYLDDSKGIKVDSNLRMSGVEDGSVFALGTLHFSSTDS